MAGLAPGEIKALWNSRGGEADFGRDGFRPWRCPIRRHWSASYELERGRDHSKPAPLEDSYVEFRLERAGYGFPGSTGHLVTVVKGNGVVVETIHHEDRKVFIPLGA